MICCVAVAPSSAQEDLALRWTYAQQQVLMTDSAAIALKDVIRLAKVQKNDTVSAEARYLLGKHYFLRMQDSIARRQFDEARRLFIQLGNWERTGYTYVQNGLSFTQDNHLDSAVIAFHKAIEVYNKYGLLQHCWTPYMGLSIVYERSGDVPAAFREARQAVAALANGADRTGRILTLHHIVQLARTYDSLQVHAAYADQLLRIYSPLEIDAQVPQHAEYFIRRADPGQREAVIRSYILQLEALPATLELVSVYYQLGRTYAETGQTTAAIDAYQHAFELEKQISKDPHFSPLLLRALSNQHALAGHYQKAFDALHQYAHLKDSLVQVSNQQRIAELQLQYETQRKDLEIEQQRAALGRRTMERNGIILLAGLMLAGGGFVFFTQRRHVKDQATINRQYEELHARELADLRKAHAIEQLQTLISTQEEERRRFAQDLHDSLGGLLASLKIHVREIVPARHQRVDPAVNEHMHLIDAVSSETRRIAHNMMPPALARIGLAPAIEDMVRQLDGDKGLMVTFQNIDFHDRIAREQEVGLYRITQELCANVVRHADARHLLIQLSRHNGSATLVVEDDGVGFDPQSALRPGIGMESIRSRVAYLEGELEWLSAPGEGTSVTIHIPVA
jgi:signal transduction histidine kinase